MIHSVSQFRSIMRENIGVIVDFTASWCGPCKMISPVFEDLSKRYTSLAFIKVDVDQMADLAAEFRIQAMPTFKVFIQNKEVDELKGADRNALEQIIKNASKKVISDGLYK